MSRLARLLQTLMPGERLLSSAPTAGPDDIEHLIGNALGPLAFAAIQRDCITTDTASMQALQAADLTARVLSDQWDQALHRLIAELNQSDIVPVLLKGASVRYRYPDRHQRLMGDIDLLVEPDRLSTTLDILESLGYVVPDEQSTDASHHHVAPRRHPRSGIWIEVHTALDSSDWFRELNHYTAGEHHESVRELPEELHARRLQPDAELRYIAAHWYLHLIENLGTQGLHRVFFDAELLLRTRASGALYGQHLTGDPVGFATATLLAMMQDIQRAAGPLPTATTDPLTHPGARDDRCQNTDPTRDARDARDGQNVRNNQDGQNGQNLRHNQDGENGQNGQNTWNNQDGQNHPDRQDGQNSQASRDAVVGLANRTIQIRQTDASSAGIRLARKLIARNLISSRPPERHIHRMIHIAWLKLALENPTAIRLRLGQMSSAIRLLGYATRHHTRTWFYGNEH